MSDPINFSILTRRIESVTRAMMSTLVRSSRSGVITSGHDCSCCIVTSGCELVSIAQTIPIHAMSGPDRMAEVMKEWHPNLKRGDAFLHNSPYHGCTHAADLCILVPVVDATGSHRFTVISKAHQADIGNSKPTTYMAKARDIYEEGALIFPAVKIQTNYQMEMDVVRLGQMRIRNPQQWYGDLLALIGSARAGESELCQLGEEFGWEVLGEFVKTLFGDTEQEADNVLRALPRGHATGESTHDAFPGTTPEGVPVKATVITNPDSGNLTIDLSDNVDCLPNGINLSEASARSAALIGAFNALPVHLPVNGGSLRRFKVILRQGSAVGIPNDQTSCSLATTNLADRVINAVHLAFAQISDQLGMAEMGAIEGPVGAVISGFDPRRGNRPYINQLALAGTAGAAGPQANGWLTMGNAGTAGMWKMDSIEITELDFPLIVNKRMLVTDTEGAGTYSGAPSCLVEYEITADSMNIYYSSDGVSNPPRGANNEYSGAGVDQWIVDDDGNKTRLPSIGELTVERGHRIICQTSAGGGYGSPLNRDSCGVAYDVEEGYLSQRKARDVYGVVCSANGDLDGESTTILRKQLACKN